MSGMNQVFSCSDLAGRVARIRAGTYARPKGLFYGPRGDSGLKRTRAPLAGCRAAPTSLRLSSKLPKLGAKPLTTRHRVWGYVRVVFGDGTMRKSVLAMLGSAAMMCTAAGSANASGVIAPAPPTANLGDDTLGGTEQFGDFVNLGDTLELTFTVPSSPGTDYLDVSQLNPTGDTLRVETWNATNSLLLSTSFLTSSDLPTSLAYAVGSYNVYVTLEAGREDPFGGFELTSTQFDLPLPSATPLPAALPLFAGGLGLIGFFSRRRKRNGSATSAV